MRRLKIMVIGFATVFVTLACSDSGSHRRDFEIAKSVSYEASLFRQNCAVCHGAEGRGKIIEDSKVPSLRSGIVKEKSEDEILLQIRYGKLPMPSFENQLTEEEMMRLARFIKIQLQDRKSEVF